MRVFTLLFFLSYVLFRATPAAYGGFQARGQIGAVASGLHQSYSNARSELHLQPTPDPQPTERGQGSNLKPRGSYSDSFLLHHDGNSHIAFLIVVHTLAGMPRGECVVTVKHTNSQGSHNCLGAQISPCILSLAGTIVAPAAGSSSCIPACPQPDPCH